MKNAKTATKGGLEGVTAADSAICKIDGKVGELRYRTLSGANRKKTVYGKTRASVKTKLAAFEREKHDSGGLLATPERRTVADLVRAYLDAKREPIRASTLENYEQRLRTHVLPRLGHVRLSRLTPQHVETWKRQTLEEGVGARARQESFDLLKRTLKYGVKLGYIARNAAHYANSA